MMNRKEIMQISSARVLNSHALPCRVSNKIYPIPSGFMSIPSGLYVHPFAEKQISMSIPLQEADFYAHPFARSRLLFSPLCKKLRSLVGLKDLETLEKAWDPSHSRSEH